MAGVTEICVAKGITKACVVAPIYPALAAGIILGAVVLASVANDKDD